MGEQNTTIRKRTLEQKTADAIAFMPAIREKLKPLYYIPKHGMQRWDQSIKDIAQTTTEQYNLVALRIQYTEWLQERGHILDYTIEPYGFILLLFQPKDGLTELGEIVTSFISTCYEHNIIKDRPNLSSYNYVSIKPLGKDNVEVAWTNDKGDPGPTYKLKLDEVSKEDRRLCLDFSALKYYFNLEDVKNMYKRQ
jgi:hypothetical protein